MGEQIEDRTGDVDMSNGESVFNNFSILKDLCNIANAVRTEDFLDIVPKAKLKRVKWVPMYNCLKQGIFDEMVQEFSAMWKYENISQKLEILEKQKEKFCNADLDKPAWRPQLGDVKAQLKARDIALLQKKKVLLESVANEYETRVEKLKKTLVAKRGYLRALQMDFLKNQKKLEDSIAQMRDKVENHKPIAQINMSFDHSTEKFYDSNEDKELMH